MGKRRKIPLVQPDPVRTLHGSIPVECLDLHGLHAGAAESRVRSFVEAWSRRERGVILRIITGKGAHSEGAPVLRAMVLELLHGDLSPRIRDWASETGGGSYLVRLK